MGARGNKMPVKSVNEFVIGLRLPINAGNKNGAQPGGRLGKQTSAMFNY